MLATFGNGKFDRYTAQVKLHWKDPPRIHRHAGTEKEKRRENGRQPS